MDRFIEQSNALMAARPDTTRVSTRLTHKKIKETGDRVVEGAKPAVAIIKTYDPVSGAVYKYRLTRINELSRILSSLGPQTVEIGASRKRGLASMMSGVEPTEPETPSAASEVVPEAAPAQKPASKSSKKKRSKK